MLSAKNAVNGVSCISDLVTGSWPLNLCHTRTHTHTYTSIYGGSFAIVMDYVVVKHMQKSCASGINLDPSLVHIGVPWVLTGLFIHVSVT